MRRVLASIIVAAIALAAGVAAAAAPSAETASPAAPAAPAPAASPLPTTVPAASPSAAAAATAAAAVKPKFDLKNPNTWPFIPVPIIATDPNSGVTGGVLPVWLYTDQNNQIRDILAPDLTANTVLGGGADFRYMAYPSEDEQWYVQGGGSWKIARYADIDYQTGRERKKWWSLEGRFFFERDPTERFYGLGNHSALGNETNYTTEQLYAEGIFGLNFTENLQLSLMERPRYVRILHGGFADTVTQLHRLFPDQKGINGGSEWLNQVMLQYDTRDSLEIPRSGGLALLYYGVADRRFGSSVSYNRFGGELRRYLTLMNRITFAGHLFIEYEPAGGNTPYYVFANHNKKGNHIPGYFLSLGGGEMPFWSMARLGGEESLLQDQQTLRGYGTGRFMDNNLFVMNIEARTKVWEADLFGTHGILELAPFAEAGRVAHNIGFDPVEGLHPVGGIGFRGVALPFVVGYVDVGWGGEGAALFTGINYPF